MENQAREPRTARTLDHHTATVDHMATVTNLARLLEVMDMEAVVVREARMVHTLVDMDLVILQRDPKLLEVMDMVDLRDPRLLEVMDTVNLRDPRHLEVMDMDIPRHLPRVASMVTIKLLMMPNCCTASVRKIDVL